MSNQHFTESRRNFLKGAAYTTALSLGGFTALGTLSSITGANSSDTEMLNNQAVGQINSGISVMQQKMLHKETVSLFNQTDDAIMLDALQPINIEKTGTALIVRPNVAMKNTCCGLIMLAPGQRVSFDIQTTGSHFSSAEVQSTVSSDLPHLHISSEHSSFNKLIPVSTAVA